MLFNEQQITELQEYLQGTCMDINQALQDCFEIYLEDVENELEMWQQIENWIFLCNGCGWCEMSQETATGQGEDDFGCIDCYPEED